jgi:hypothetical protein
MACDIISNEGAVFALWGKPSKADLERVLNRVELVATAAGSPIVYIARVPSAAPAPDGEVRAHLNQLMPRFVKLCAGYHVVLEGNGFGSALKRCVLTSLLQFGWRNGSFFVHQDINEVFAKLSPASRSGARALLDLAGHGGLLSSPPPLDLQSA